MVLYLTLPREREATAGRTDGDGIGVLCIFLPTLHGFLSCSGCFATGVPVTVLLGMWVFGRTGIKKKLK
jgi:hypothetical protein